MADITPDRDYDMGEGSDDTMTRRRLEDEETV
jgi:hypothetical protein